MYDKSAVSSPRIQFTQPILIQQTETDQVQSLSTSCFTKQLFLSNIPRFQKLQKLLSQVDVRSEKI